MKKSADLVIRRRINWVLLFFFLLGIAILSRFFVLQIVYHREYVKLASRQHRLVQEVFSERGIILAQDKEGKTVPLALNQIKATLASSPKEVKSEDEVEEFLQKEFGLKIETVRSVLSRADDPYVVVVKGIEGEKVVNLRERLPDGLFLEEEKRRIYPRGVLGAHLIGFVSKEKDREEGRYGLEKYYERELAGEKGILQSVKDASGLWVTLGKRIFHPPKNGARLVTTLDYNIQLKAEEILEKTRGKWSAASGVILVLNPQDGKILAIASRPAFNPNQFFKEKNFSVFLNPVVESMFELGSVLKPITMAAGLEEKAVSPESTYMDPGELKIGGYTIRNFDGKSYKTQTMIQVLEKSLNTGAVYVARLIGKEKQLEYLKRFGFGVKTGVDLPGEVVGDISNLERGTEIDFATASFGQGIAVTPLQLALATGAIANGGKLMKPYVVESIIDDSGNEFKKEPEILREVISQETSEKLTKMLVSAVRNGFENKAGVRGYFVAGKTGTAQIPRSDGRGYSNKVIHTFVGYAPAFNPKFLILLQLNEPESNRFAANTLTPAFHDLAEYILNYYEIPPDER